MDDVREQVVANLSQRGILPSLKAQLRAAVFAAIYDTDSSGRSLRCDRRDWLLSTEEGLSVAALVREFLVWAELLNTVKVYDAESEAGQELGSRAALMQQLSISDARDQPLLLTILQAFLQHQPVLHDLPTQLQFGSFSKDVHEEYEHGNRAEAEIENLSTSPSSWPSPSGNLSSLIKAVHLQNGTSPVDKYEDAESQLSYGAGPAGRAGQSLGAGGIVDFKSDIAADSPPLRSNPTRIADLGEVSPTRRSVEELKKQLQAQGLLLTSPQSSPEKPKSAHSEQSA